MAITDNNFTAEELEAASTANPALVSQLTGFLTKKEYTVHDKDAHAKYLQTYEANVIGPKTKNLADKIEADVEALTGIKKATSDEKYYDYLKRAFTEKMSGIETELTTLKGKHNPSEADKARIDALEKAISDKTTEYEAKLSEKDKAFNGLKAGNVINSAVLKLRAKYKASIPADVAEMAEAAVLGDVANHIRFESKDGKEIAVIVDDKGTVVLNPTTFHPITVDERIASLLSNLIDETKVITGAGSGAQRQETAESGKFTSLPATVKTRVQLTDYLLSLGILAGSTEFNKLFAEHSKDLKLR